MEISSLEGSGFGVQHVALQNGKVMLVVSIPSSWGGVGEDSLEMPLGLLDGDFTAASLGYEVGPVVAGFELVFEEGHSRCVP